MKPSKYEDNFIMGIYRTRHKFNDVIILIPIIASLLYTILIAPILITLCDIPWPKSIYMIVVPFPLVAVILKIRKDIITQRFIKEKDVSKKVEVCDIVCNAMEEWEGEKVLMFAFSEQMVVTLFNWLDGIGAIRDERLVMYKVEYSYSQIKYIAIRENDLSITDENRGQYELESKDCLRMEDIWKGKAVDTKLVSRIVRE